MKDVYSSIIDQCFADADRDAQELFGNRQNLPGDESLVVFDFTVSHKEKVERLKTIRTNKRRGSIHLV
jgi:hypothetical protein